MESTQPPQVGTGSVIAELNTPSIPNDSSCKVFFTYRSVKFVMVIRNNFDITGVQCNHEEHLIDEVWQCPQYSHLMCRKCCFPSREATSQLCPIHKEPVFYDKFKSRSICSETVTCPVNTTFEATCPWSGKYSEVAGHLDVCTFIPSFAGVTMQNATEKVVEQRAEQKCEEFKKIALCQLQQIKKEFNDRLKVMQQLLDEVIPDLTNKYKELQYLVDNLSLQRPGLPVSPAAPAASLVAAIDDQGPLFCNSELIWPIENFSSKLQLAKTDAMHRSIESPPFWTSVSGYKMRLKLFPNGDGDGRDKYISIFFQIMEGRFDGVLQWPFKNMVTLKILGYDKKNLSDCFRGNPGSDSFQRPRHGPNRASGCPKFVLQQKLIKHKDVYLRDDTLFVKVIVS